MALCQFQLPDWNLVRFVSKHGDKRSFVCLTLYNKTNVAVKENSIQTLPHVISISIEEPHNVNIQDLCQISPPCDFNTQR